MGGSHKGIGLKQLITFDFIVNALTKRSNVKEYEPTEYKKMKFNKRADNKINLHLNTEI